ncbi:hypothetical protein O3S81_25030 [Agrobacterium sp. SOY23]|uniref:nSTAND3 domain-containing NTPase n=1 Tax=Agrobacterium sp. SOY23 TaxID=3014555 RepID=UPI0022B004C1|nr:hypothetical protein [Agrobacterium sp. SOY23]MCZ4432979.1 hypothetical protein [Agrobacterium sp. SOY23]
MSEMTGAAPSAGAAAALAGFEYQLDVSVLAALRLLLINKSTSQIVLEPADEEDLGADIGKHVPGRLTPTATVAAGYRLIIQVKLVSGEPWSLEDFDALLKHGTKRTPAYQRLENTDAHYLLVTSCGVKGKLIDLRVSAFEEETDRSKFPSSLRATLSKKPEGRVAVLSDLSPQLLKFEIETLLRDILRVPQINLAKCKEELRSNARRRMLGAYQGIWSYDDLHATVRAHGGYLASAPQLASFVAPANFDDMLRMLKERNAVVIKGPSGSGKTIAALALCEKVREQDGGTQIVAVSASDDPAATRRLTDTGPTLFYIEDPWGQVTLRAGADAWTSQLPKLLAAARPEHRYIVTSRSDMLREAHATSKLTRWSIELGSEDYLSGELGLIYDKRLELLAPSLQTLALSFRKDALDVLTTPMEIDLFFTNLADGPEEKEVPRAFFQRLREMAHREAVEDVVSDYLRQYDTCGTSAPIWALLTAKGQFDRNQLTAFQRELRGINADIGSGLEKLVDRLEATRHLRQPGRIVSFAHPGVRAGFEAFLAEDWSQSENALAATVDSLLNVKGNYSEWAIETAARIVSTAQALAISLHGSKYQVPFDDQSRDRIDAWLEEALCDRSTDFVALLRLAAEVGSKKSPLCELGRWFHHGFRRGGNWFNTKWEAPVFEDAWYEWIAGDARTPIVVDRFIREQLVQDHHASFGRDFAEKLDRFTTDTTAAFIATAFSLVRSGYSDVVKTVVGGAVRDLTAYEPLLVEALDELRSIEDGYTDQGEQWRQIEDGELDAAYEDYLSSAHEDDGYGASTIVEYYIAAKRLTGAWFDLASHTRVQELLGQWIRQVRNDSKSGAAEMLAVLQRAKETGDEEDAWEMSRTHWSHQFEPLLVERFLQTNDDRIRAAVSQCLPKASAATAEQCLASARQSAVSQIKLVVALRDGCQHYDDTSLRLESASLILNGEERDILNALRSPDQPAGIVGPSARSLLEAAAKEALPPLLDRIVPIISASGGQVAEMMRRWLLGTADHKVAARAAAFAAERRDDLLLRGCLSHTRADARGIALEYFLATLPDPLPPEILATAIDRGSRVKKSLVKALKSRVHTAYLPALVRMARDTWSDAEPHHDDPASYPIARGAVSALASYQNLPVDLADHLLEIASTSKDRELSRLCLKVAAAKFSHEVHVRLWDTVHDQKLGIIRLDAIDALAFAPSLKPEILEGLTAEAIAEAHVAFAPGLTRLISSHLPVEEAAHALAVLSSRPSRRSLALVGAVALHMRDPHRAKSALSFLPEGHQAWCLLGPPTGKKLPMSILDGLGDIHLRQWIGFALEDWIKVE